MDTEQQRYSRSLPVIGLAGQERLWKARILVVGIGGLGCPAALQLAAAGVGTLGLCDGDRVEGHNLPRQTLYTPQDIGKNKAMAATDAIRIVNPATSCLPYPVALSEENAKTVIEAFDIVLDGTDNLAAKHLINRTCRALGKPLVHGAAVGFEGRLAVFTPSTGCLSCMLGESAASSCAVEGVFPSVPGVIGLLQATEALKLATGRPALEGLLIYSAQSGAFKVFGLPRRSDCSVCAGGKGMPVGSSITPRQLFQLREQGAVQVVDVREPWEREICGIGGSVLIPLGELALRAGEIDKRQPVVTYCHTQTRSREAQRLLSSRGFRCLFLEGGISRWAEEIEPAMERY